MALANGSPDVITSIVAGGESGGTLLSIGALFGASLFTCNFVFSICVGASPSQEISLKPRHFLRDTLFFSFSAFLLIVLGFFDLKLYWITVILLGIYTIYVVMVLAAEQADKKDEENKIEDEKEHKDTILPPSDGTESAMAASFDDHTITINAESVMLPSDVSTTLNTDSEGYLKAPENKVNGEGLNGGQVDKTFRKSFTLTQSASGLLKTYAHSLNQRWGDMNIFDKICYPLEYPFHLAM